MLPEPRVEVIYTYVMHGRERDLHDDGIDFKVQFVDVRIDADDIASATVTAMFQGSDGRNLQRTFFIDTGTIGGIDVAEFRADALRRRADSRLSTPPTELGGSPS